MCVKYTTLPPSLSLSDSLSFCMEQRKYHRRSFRDMPYLKLVAKFRRHIPSHVNNGQGQDTAHE